MNDKVATEGVLLKKGVLRNFTKLTGKYLYQSLSLNKVEPFLKRKSVFLDVQSLLLEKISYLYLGKIMVSNSGKPFSFLFSLINLITAYFWELLNYSFGNDFLRLAMNGIFNTSQNIS